MKFKLIDEELEDKFIESERYDWVEDEEESKWEKVKSKSVIDEDGFTTEYVWYKGINPDTNKIIHIFMFGDSDINEPSIEYADWTADSELEAREWFDNYESGYKSEEDIEADEDEEWEALLKQWEEEDRENGLFDDEIDETLSEDKKEDSHRVQTMTGLKGDMDEDLKEEDTENRECEWCGKEFETNKDSDETYCPECRYGVRVSADIDEDIKSDCSESEFAKKYPDRFAKLEELFDKNGLEKISAKDLDDIAIIFGVDLSKTDDDSFSNLEEDFEDEHIGKSTRDKKETISDYSKSEEENKKLDFTPDDDFKDSDLELTEEQAKKLFPDPISAPTPNNLQPIITNKLNTNINQPQIISEGASNNVYIQNNQNPNPVNLDEDIDFDDIV